MLRMSQIKGVGLTEALDICPGTMQKVRRERGVGC